MTTAADLARLDATAQAQLVHSGAATATELVQAAIERIEALNPSLNAVVTTQYERALDRALLIDRDPGRAALPFAGVPLLVKDLVAEEEGTPFTEGSRFLAGYCSTFTSEIVHRFSRAGFVILGRTNSPEFGMVPACEPALHGATRNPWSLAHSTSGSSGGSAAAVASGIVPIAHGNDLGGSLRYPASACGVFGLKPSRARVPLGPEYGDVLNGWAAEHGLTRTVRDSALLLDVIGGASSGDPYPAPPASPFSAEVGRDPQRLRIAYSTRTADGGTGHPDCVAALDDAVALCTSLGHELIEADLPGLTPQVGDAIGVMFNVATAWIVGYWVRKLGREPTPDELEPLTRAMWDEGRRISGADYLLAVEDTQAFARVIANFLSGTGEGYDAFLTPTLSEPPARIGEITSSSDDPWRALHRGGRTVAYSAVVANITGNPAMSVPLWWNADGLPIGVHVLGTFGGEGRLFRLAGQLERARPFTARTPPVLARSARLR